MVQWRRRSGGTLTSRVAPIAVCQVHGADPISGMSKSIFHCRQGSDGLGMDIIDITRVLILAEVRHDAHKKWSNPLRISSRSRRVYTTLAVETEAVRKADAQQVEKRFLLSGSLCNPAQSDFAAVCGGQNDVAAVQFG
jgi:hypothetical protein